MRNRPAVTDVLLDVEGTTSSISFVHDVLFPYARDRLRAFVAENGERPEVVAELERARNSLRAAGYPVDTREAVIEGLLRYIDEDVKDTALKALQGMIWRSGFESGAFRAHVYPDVPSALQRWTRSGVLVSIYSSGSTGAQKLFFGHTTVGSLLPYLHEHFDTQIGPKSRPDSYVSIADRLGRPSSGMLFLSDVGAELDAAATAGYRTAQVLRPGIEPVREHPSLGDFDAVGQHFQLGSL